MIFYKIYDKLNKIISTLWMRLILLLLGIKSNKSIFIGLCRFNLAPKTQILLGDNCEFRSSSTSNLIGINRPCIVSTLQEDAKLCIGNNCGFSGTVIGCFKDIKIGNNVRCGANSLITDSDWHNDDYRSGACKSIIIEDNVWIGEGAKIMKGVHIGKNSVIGAGSIVTSDIPANVIAAGIPCKVVKPLHCQSQDFYQSN